MKKKFFNILMLCVIVMTCALGTICIHIQKKYSNQVEKLQTSCKENMEYAAESLEEYKKNKTTENLEYAAEDIHRFLTVYDLMPEEVYNYNVHFLVNQISLKIDLNMEVSDTELDILIDGLSMLSKDFEDLDAYHLLTKFTTSTY